MIHSWAFLVYFDSESIVLQLSCTPMCQPSIFEMFPHFYGLSFFCNPRLIL